MSISTVALVVLLSMKAGAASLSASVPSWPDRGKSAIVDGFKHTNEGTKASYTQGRNPKALLSSLLSLDVPVVGQVPALRPTEHLARTARSVRLYSTYFSSSFCNKAPPVA